MHASTEQAAAARAQLITYERCTGQAVIKTYSWSMDINTEEVETWLVSTDCLYIYNSFIHNLHIFKSWLLTFFYFRFWFFSFLIPAICVLSQKIQDPHSKHHHLPWFTLWTKVWFIFFLSFYISVLKVVAFFWITFWLSFLSKTFIIFHAKNWSTLLCLGYKAP